MLIDVIDLGDIDTLERPIHVVLLLLSALVLTALLCMGLIFALVGDEIVDLARTSWLRIQLASREAELGTPIGDDTTLMRFTISPGDTASMIGVNLETAGLIRDGALFRDYARVEGLDTEFEIGTYFLNKAQTIREIALVLTDSRSSQISLTILPGWRIEEIADAIDINPLFGFSGADFLSVVGRGANLDQQIQTRLGLVQGRSLEGFLYPDTYTLPPDVTQWQLRDILLETFLERVSPDLDEAILMQELSLYEVVTLASIVEREALHTDEKPLIAGVYLNRLAIGMRLEADPTVQYPLGQPGDWWPRITRADYQGVLSDYNTYRINGLPPGPIASPAITSIEAVLRPEPSNYFFFRADCRSDGYHDFATTFEEHLANGC